MCIPRNYRSATSGIFCIFIQHLPASVCQICIATVGPPIWNSLSVRCRGSSFASSCQKFKCQLMTSYLDYDLVLHLVFAYVVTLYIEFTAIFCCCFAMFPFCVCVLFIYSSLTLSEGRILTAAQLQYFLYHVCFFL